MAAESRKLLEKEGLYAWLGRRCPRLYRLIKSPPNQYRCVKFFVGLIYGLFLGLGLQIVAIKPMILPDALKGILGLLFTVTIALGCALSVQVRCICTLVLPSVFGKNGRSYVWTFALACLLAGPISNMMDNAREVIRFSRCNADLIDNQTRARTELQYKPVHDIMTDLQYQGRNIDKMTSKIRKQFVPITVEVEDERDVDKMRHNIEDADNVDETNKEDRNRQIENRHRGKKGPEDLFERKMDYRCEEVYSLGVVHCREVFVKTEKKCMDKLSILGHALCWPLKITAMCELVKHVPGLAGISCNSEDAVNQGFGESYQTAKLAAEDLDDEFDVEMKYQMIKGDTVLKRKTAQDITKAVEHEFERRRRIFDAVLNLMSKLIAFMFLRVIFSALGYHEKYVTNFKFDNNYITNYFRWIDARRFAQSKRILLPMKKVEKADVTDPKSISLSSQEKSKLASSSVRVVLRGFAFFMIVVIDKIIYEVMDIIRRHSQVDVRQTGTHHIALIVYGDGVMGHLVKTLLRGLNSKHEIDNFTTNTKCLPHPTLTPHDSIVKMFLFVGAVQLLTLLEAYCLRLRPIVAGFFYPRRDKRRTLCFYNGMLKKRKGFLRHARHTIIRRARAQKLDEKMSFAATLRYRFPRICSCLGAFGVGRKCCLVCKEPEKKKFVHCRTPGCDMVYCGECWMDIKMNCYACRDEDDWDSESSEITDLDF